MRHAPLLLSLSLLLLSSPAAANPRLERKLDNATEILADLAEHVPEDTWARAQCAAVMTIGKGGFIFGGTGGAGFLSCRRGHEGWSAPTVLHIGGGSAGAQIGGQRAEVLMLYLDVQDLEDVTHATPLFQGNASSTAGPAGIGIAWGGNPGVEAHSLTVSRSEGLYAGAIGEGLVVNPADDANSDLYGQEVDMTALLLDQSISAEGSVARWRAALGRASR